MTIDAKRDLANISAREFACRKRFETPNVDPRTSKPPRCYGMNFKERRRAPTDDGGQTRRGALGLAFSRCGAPRAA